MWGSDLYLSEAMVYGRRRVAREFCLRGSEKRRAMETEGSLILGPEGHSDQGWVS